MPESQCVIWRRKGKRGRWEAISEPMSAKDAVNESFELTEQAVASRSPYTYMSVPVEVNPNG